MNNILITGGTGYLGSHIIEELLKDHYNVILLKLSSADESRIIDKLHQIKTYNVDKIDIELPFKENRVDAIIHCATIYGRNNEKFSEIYNTNTVFPLKLLETAVNHKIPLFLNTDTALDKYLNYYSLSKKHFSEIGKFFSEKKQIKFFNIHLEHFYGPNDDISKFPTYIIKSCLNNIDEIELTSGEQKRDFIYIDDVVSAYILLLKKYIELTDYYYDIALGSGDAVRIADFVKLVHRETASTTRLLFGAIPYRENEVMESKSDIRILKNLGWETETSLQEGIRRIIKEESR